MNRTLSVVTGASSGIGEAFARALAARSHDLVLVARRRDRLQALASELHAQHGGDAHVVVGDLAKPTGVDDVLNAIDALSRPVDLLVNNAGVGSYGRFAELPLDRELALVDVNVRALVALTGAVLPGMLARGEGTILQIASTTSFQPVPYMASYGASKAFVLSFAEAVAAEIEGTGVRMMAVCPGHTPTEFQKRSGVDRRPMRTSSQSAEEVVGEVLQHLDCGGGPVVVTGRPNRLTTQLPRVLPRRMLRWAIERAFRPVS